MEFGQSRLLQFVFQNQQEANLKTTLYISDCFLCELHSEQYQQPTF